jgi:hypothetical protein
MAWPRMRRSEYLADGRFHSSKGRGLGLAPAIIAPILAEGEAMAKSCEGEGGAAAEIASLNTGSRSERILAALLGFSSRNSCGLCADESGNARCESRIGALACERRAPVFRAETGAK